MQWRTIDIIFVILGTLAGLSVIGLILVDFLRGQGPLFGGTVTKYSMVVKWSDRDVCFFASCPELPGLLTHGPTRAQATAMFEEALELYLETAKDTAMTPAEPMLFEEVDNVTPVS